MNNNGLAYLNDLGTFSVNSETLRVTDPCYNKNTWCAGDLKKVKNGEWKANTLVFSAGLTGWGPRNAELRIFLPGEIPTTKWTKSKIDVGVDSGQAGFFANYPEEPRDDGWYDNICDLSLSRYEGGVIQDGVVSRSGFGDGGYKCYYRKNNEGKIVSAKIVFITKKEIQIPTNCYLSKELALQKNANIDIISFKNVSCDGLKSHTFSNDFLSRHFYCVCDIITANLHYNEFITKYENLTKIGEDKEWVELITKDLY
jgi:hypothetical protein